MATFPLMWLEVEGDDIHALRRGPPSQTSPAGFSIKSRFALAQFRMIFKPEFRRAQRPSDTPRPGWGRKPILRRGHSDPGNSESVQHRRSA